MKIRHIFCLLVLLNYSNFLSSQDVLMGIKEVDPGTTPHKLTLFYTFQADFVSPGRHIWNSQLFMLRYSSTLPAPATFISGTVDENCFDWTGFSVGEFNGDHYIIYNDSDGATCQFNNSDVIDMLTINFDETSTSFSTADFEIVPPGDPSIANFGFGEPAINNAASGINEFNGFNPGTVSGLVLPIKLTAFSAKTAGINAILHWETASEINFSHFDIQRSTDQHSWENIGKTIGKEQADHSPIHYQWLDKNALLQTRKSQLYYRLKMVDIDHTFSYSSVRSISVPKINNGLSFYPNPASDILSINISNWIGAPISVTLIDFQGRKVFEQSFTESAEINVRNLPAGMYLAQMQEKNGTLLLTKRVIIQ